MDKKDLLDFVSHIEGEDTRIAIVYVDPDGEGDAEEGDILEILSSGYEPLHGHVLRVGKV